jgi:hypothetical protein
VTWSGAASGSRTLSGEAFAGLARTFDYGLDEDMLNNLTSGLVPAVTIDDDAISAMMRSIWYRNIGTDPFGGILSAKTFNALNHAVGAADERSRAAAAAELEQLGKLLAARDAQQKRELAERIEALVGDPDNEETADDASPGEVNPLSKTPEPATEPPSQQE